MPQGLPESFQPIEPDATPENTGLPASFQPVDAGPPPESTISKLWHWASDPLTDAPSRFAKSVGDWIDQPSNEDESYLSGVKARAKGFTAGALEGIGNLASGFTSPISLATLGLGGTEAVAAKTGLESVATAANLANKATGAAMAAHGATNVLHPDSTLQERMQGVTEMAGGGMGMFHSPAIKTVGKGATEAAAEAATKEAPKGAAPKSSGLPEGVVDPYAQYREVPVGTKYKMAPENFNGKKMRDAIKLGFDIKLNEEGKIEVTKVRESPKVNMPDNPVEESNIAGKIVNLPRELMASMDMSAPLRQGLGMIHKKQFWQALPDMAKAFGSEEFYQSAMKDITEDPMFKRRVTAQGQVKPSFAEEAGLKLTDLKGMSTREESMLSGLGEKFVPGVRASNRAYTLFLNKLRADTFKQMVNDYSAFSGINMRNNLKLATDLAEVVNTATGRGSLGKLEPAANALSSVFFSPRLMASRLQMLNPQYYVRLNPIARKEALKSLFAVAGATGTFTGLMKMAGAEVESDPASSDFGKPKFGNTRIDPYGGFQQYIVAAQRLMPHIDMSSAGLGQIGGQMKSTTTGKEYSLDDAGFGRSNRADVLFRFLRSKTNPIINFGWGLLAGQKELSGKPMNLTTANPFENSLAQRFLPMLSQDIYDLVNDETTPAAQKALSGFLASVGMGSQTYGNER